MEPDIHFFNKIKGEKSKQGPAKYTCGATVLDLPIRELFSYVVGQGWTHSNWKHVTCMGCILVRFADLTKED